MRPKAQKARADLRAKLLELAEAQITADGVRSLRARALAQEAGCAVGAIYNVFEDLPSLVLAVNAQTFDRLDREVAHISQGMADAPPIDQLIALSDAYLVFADENRQLWRALFEYDWPEDDARPEWYVKALTDLLKHIEAPVARMLPDQGREERDLLVRALFSSVHGIVALGVGGAEVGVPREKVSEMIELILRRAT